MTSKTNAVASSTVSRFGARYDALGLSVVRTELSSGDGMEMVGEETDDNPLAPQAGLLQDASGGHGPMSTPLESPLQSPLLPSTSFTERDARFKGSTPGAPDQKLVDESFAFLYDGIGNRLTAQKGTDTTAYTPNALNQYTAIDGIEPVYDADGNLFSDGKNRYHWDAENRLTLVEPLVPTEGSQRLEFKYDYIGRRVSKQVWTHTGGSWTDDSTTAFVYDGWNLIEEIATSSQTASINHYTWGLDLSLSLQGAGGVGGLLSVVCAPFTESGLIGDWLLPIGYVPPALSNVEGPAPSTFHYTYDLNGNVSEVLDESGSIAAHYEYGPFGEMLVESYSAGLGTAGASFRFSTKYFDAELKTLYYGYRYYDPTTGRWINRDPIEESGGLNLYGFVGNDAVNSWDLWGMQVRSETVGECEIVIFAGHGPSGSDSGSVEHFQNVSGTRNDTVPGRISTTGPCSAATVVACFAAGIPIEGNEVEGYDRFDRFYLTDATGAQVRLAVEAARNGVGSMCGNGCCDEITISVDMPDGYADELRNRNEVLSGSWLFRNGIFAAGAAESVSWIGYSETVSCNRK